MKNRRSFNERVFAVVMNNDALVRYLKEEVRVLATARLEQAFRTIDRAHFVPKKLREEAYADDALPIGFGATISQPTTVAFMLEKLRVKEGQKVLDIGSGSGWTTALLAHLVGPKGKVTGLEVVPELVALGRKNLAAVSSYIPRNVGIRQARRGVVGLPEEAPFDRVLVSAAAQEVPQELLKQLKPNGGLVIPVGAPHEMQKIVRIHKKRNNALELEEYPGFVFVPLQ